MAVPTYEAFMLPLLRFASDGKEHTISETIDAMIAALDISKEDQVQMLPSGTQTRLYSRVTWALFHLGKAFAVERVGRGRFRITDRGRELLATNPSQVDVDDLDAYDEYRSFREAIARKAAQRARTSVAPAADVDQDNTPAERLNAAYDEIRTALVEELLNSCPQRNAESVRTARRSTTRCDGIRWWSGGPRLGDGQVRRWRHRW